MANDIVKKSLLNRMIKEDLSIKVSKPRNKNKESSQLKIQGKKVHGEMELNVCLFGGKQISKSIHSF